MVNELGTQTDGPGCGDVVVGMVADEPDLAQRRVKPGAQGPERSRVWLGDA